jgi:hypothetical protein
MELKAAIKPVACGVNHYNRGKAEKVLHFGI